MRRAERTAVGAAAGFNPLALTYLNRLSDHLFVLVKGVIGMAQQKDMTGQRSQQLMQKRILFQAIAIILAILLLLVLRSGS